MYALFVILLSLAHVPIALAAESSESRVKASGMTDVEEANDVDDLLTNKQMRASSGSKSKWSIATGLNYGGGRISSPFSEERPNIANSTGTTDYSEADGSVSVKYSIASQHSLLAGVGLRWLTPFQGGTKPAGYTGNKVDASNPYLNYQYIYNWHGLQSVAGVNNTFFTASDLVARGYVYSLGFQQNTAYEFGHTGITVGALAYTGFGFYNRNDPVSRVAQSDYSFGFLPFLEYQISERVNFHTGWNLWVFEHTRDQRNANTYRWDAVVENVGLGISITRDIFLYPNVQFKADNIRADRTTVGISSNINIF